jgi:hypothetical protein
MMKSFSIISGIADLPPLLPKKCSGMEPKFEDFLHYFPEVALPVTLTEESYQEHSAAIPPLPVAMIEHFLMSDDEEDDGMTEYIPCFRLPDTHEYKALVFWRAGLLNYEYILQTYTIDGKGIIDNHVIAGTFVKGTEITQAVARIDPDKMIYTATGVLEEENEFVEASNNTISVVEIYENGTIGL